MTAHTGTRNPSSDMMTLNSGRAGRTAWADILLVALAALFANFAVAVVSQTTVFVRSTFAIPQSEIGAYLAIGVLGVVPGVFIAAGADRWGRARMFTISVLGLGASSVAAASSPSIELLIAAQFVQRAFITASLALSFVIVAEVAPAASRGQALGAVGAMGALGFALSAALMMVLGDAQMTWRLLFAAVGAVLLFVFPMRRAALSSDVGDPDARGTEGAIRFDLRPRRSELWLIARVCFLAVVVQLALTPFNTLAADYLMSTAGWSAQAFGAVFMGSVLVAAGAGAALANLSDRVGRRVVAMSCYSVFTAAAIAFFALPASTYVAGAYVVALTATVGGLTMVRSLGAEVLPTRIRALSAGCIILAEGIGEACSLWAVSITTPTGGSIVPGIITFACMGIVATLVAYFLPEPAGLTLDGHAGENETSNDLGST